MENKRFNMNKKKITVIAASAAVVMVAVCLWVGLRYFADNRMSNFEKEYVLYVYPETSAEAAMDSLCANAGVRRAGSLSRCAAKENLTDRIRAGRYEISPSMSAVYVVRMLCNGWQSPQKLTLSGTIRSKGKLAAVIGRQMMVDSVTVDSLLNSDAFLEQFGFNSENVFALFLPDTYYMYWTATPEEIFSRFRKEYDIFWNGRRLELAASQDLTPMEVSTLASIVNGETLQQQEYPLIAGVYLNRLHKGMRLQADPTVAFCFDYELDRILKKHTRVDSPYNTYRYAGLPPAPINVPSKACIDAVLNPDTHNYLYFCASPDFNGTHRFAASYSEHLRNARAFQRALTARQRAAAAEQ